MAQTPLFHGDTVSTDRIIYTPSDFARSSLLHIQEIGELQAERPHTSHRSELDSYLFFTVVSGSGSLSYNGTIYELRPGSCVFIDCHDDYYHRTSDELWRLKWVHFNGPTMPLIYRKYLERGGLPAFTPQGCDSYLNTWASIHKAASGSDHVRDMQINSGLSALLTLLMSDSWHPVRDNAVPDHGSKRALLADLHRYLDEHHTEKITLDDLAERYFINKFYLTRIFHEQYGTTISSYLLNVRISHAKQLLRFSDRSAEQIGIECGIGPLSYFSRTFKKVEGIGPKEYRKGWR